MKTSSRTIDADQDEQPIEQIDLVGSLPPKPRSTRRSEPKILDWDPTSSEKEPSRGRFGRRKTAPSVDNTPQYYRPIFSGRTISKSPLRVSTHSLAEANKDDKVAVTHPLTSSSRNSISGHSDFDPILLIRENLRKFIFTTVPADYCPFVQCSLRRDRTGIQQNLFPTFYLHAERPADGKKSLLMAARRVPKVNRQTKYLITTDIETLWEKSGGTGYVGKLRGNNLLGTEYTLYDNGVHPSKFKSSLPNDRTGLRRELATVIYNSNFLGLKGPRQLTALLPEPSHDLQPTKHEDTILDQWHQRRLGSLLQLRNRVPKYNEEEKAYTLEFTNDRIGPSSLKNFQLIMETANHEEKVVMQFGRINDDTFTCDYRHPLSAVQAFGIALSAFDSRLTRE